MRIAVGAALLSLGTAPQAVPPPARALPKVAFSGTPETGGEKDFTSERPQSKLSGQPIAMN